MSSRPASSLLAALLMAALVVLVPDAGRARSPGAAAALQHLAGVPAARLMERLRASHAQVNAALKDRASKLKAYEAAAARRERSASRVEELKNEGTRGAVLEKALREALVRDEAAQRARSQLLAAEAEVARKGAELLQIYDAVLVEQGRQLKAMGARDARRSRAVAAYKKLAQQRVAVRKALQPVLVSETSASPSLDQVRASPEDDVETLLEKADLARDLEERFLRRAEQVRRRINELKEEQDLANDTLGMMDQGNLFDEGDYRPVFVGGPSGTGPRAPNGFTGGAPVLAAAGGAAAPQADEVTPPPENSNVELDSPAPNAPSDDPAPVDTDGDFAAGRDDMGEAADPISPPPGLTGGQEPDVGGRSTGDPAPTVRALPAEQVFLGPGAAADVTIKQLINSDELTLEQLRQLEKRLKREARAMRSENQKIQKQLRGQMRR